MSDHTAMPRGVRALNQGYHSHVCSKCKTILVHSDENSGSNKAHTCPNCGNKEFSRSNIYMMPKNQRQAVLHGGGSIWYTVIGTLSTVCLIIGGCLIAIAISDLIKGDA